MKILSECTVLIVDDTEENLDILIEALSDDYDISVAMDGETALESLNQELPDIILMDIMMNGMDGYELCSKIKENIKLKDIPIIFLTAITDVESKAKGFELGAVDYITKPFEILEVKARVKTHLSLKLVQGELGEKNKSLKDKAEELQSMISELEAFSYTVSHDLKSPLRAIQLYLRTVIEEDVKMEVLSKEMLKSAKNISGDMIEMIDKLLKYSKMNGMNINKEEVKISDIFLTALNQYRDIYAEKSVKFEFETGMPQVLADEILIRQVVDNIISNALKFTKNKEKPHIIAGCKKGNEEYIFYVKDNGVGFNKEYSKKLFNIFQRLHGEEEFEGSGIGLATVKKIVQKHGGKAWIEGKINEGATVYFTLPK